VSPFNILSSVNLFYESIIVELSSFVASSAIKRFGAFFFYKIAVE